MTPLLAQMVAALVVLVTLMVLLLMGNLLWLQRRALAEPDRQREARRQWLAARRTGSHPPSFKSPPR